MGTSTSRIAIIWGDWATLTRCSRLQISGLKVKSSRPAPSGTTTSTLRVSTLRCWPFHWTPQRHHSVPPLHPPINTAQGPPPPRGRRPHRPPPPLGVGRPQLPH